MRLPVKLLTLLTPPSSGGVTPPPPSPFLTGLGSVWNFDEFSDKSADVPRLDTFGSNTLTESARIASTTGLISLAALLTGAEEFTAPDAVNLHSGSAFTCEIWVYPTDLSGNRDIVYKGNAAFSITGYLLRQNAGTSYQYYISPSSGVFISVSSANGAVLNAWNQILFSYDGAANTINIRVNNGTKASQDVSGTPPRNTTEALEIGASGGGSANFVIGRLDLGRFWQRVLTTAEENTLWNGGAGYSFL